MPSITELHLTISNAFGAHTASALVTGVLTFDRCDVGRSYRLAITLFGEDLPGDDLPLADAPGDDALYAFRWGLSRVPYKLITVGAPGPQPLHELAAVSGEALNEDSGAVPTQVVGSLPRGDEVYAKATLSGAPLTVKSNVERFGGFV
jgi:hypothetical protein